MNNYNLDAADHAPSFKKLLKYKTEKEKIAKTAKNHKDYERRIQELCRKLGV